MLYIYIYLQKKTTKIVYFDRLSVNEERLLLFQSFGVTIFRLGALYHPNDSFGKEADAPHVSPLKSYSRARIIKVFVSRISSEIIIRYKLYFNILSRDLY